MIFHRWRCFLIIYYITCYSLDADDPDEDGDNETDKNEK